MVFFNRSNINYLVAGLGNPGKKYELTRHNVGFRALDCFAQRFGIRVTRARFSALVGEGNVSGSRVVLIKPTTFMNLSGTAVLAAAHYYKIPPERVIVLCDDVALAPGVIRIRAEGSSGGQKGLMHIIDTLETESIPRIRIGIGQKPNPAYEMADYVLSMPSSAERKLIEARYDDICDALALIINGNLPLAQSRYNK